VRIKSHVGQPAILRLQEFIMAARFGPSAPLWAQAISTRRKQRGPQGRKIPIGQVRRDPLIVAATSRAGAAVIVRVPIHTAGCCDIRR